MHRGLIRAALTFFAVIAVCLLTSSLSHAQTFQPRRSIYRSLTPARRPVSTRTDGGIKFAGLALHPGISVGGGYDSNVFFNSVDEGPEGAPEIRLMPTVRLDTPDPRRLRLVTNLQLLWQGYLSDDERIRAQSGVDVLGDISLQIAPRGLVSFTIYDVLRRYTSSPNEPALRTRNRLYNEVGGTLGFHPGGADRTNRRGFTAELTAGYGIDRWDESLQLNRNLFLSRLVARYFFLPKTAALLNLSYNRINYQDADRTATIPEDDPIWDEFEGTLVNIDSTPFRITGGISGLLTRSVDFRIEGGYGLGNYADGPDVSTFLANVELGLFVSPDAHIGVGWDHGFNDTSFGNYYTYNRAFADLEVTSGDWLVGIRAAYELQQYATIEVPTIDIGGTSFPLYSTSDREDPIITGTVLVTWNITDWVRLASYYRFRGNLTDFETTSPSSTPGLPNIAQAQYLKHEIFLAGEFEY